MLKRLVPVASAFLLLIACTPAYKSVDEGPRARINFESPSLIAIPLYDVNLHLAVYEPNEDCSSFSPEGKIHLNPGEDTQVIYVHANETVFLLVKLDRNKIAGGGNSTFVQFPISFVPLDGAEYTIEYTDSEGDRTVRQPVKVFEHGPNNERKLLKVSDWTKDKTQCIPKNVNQGLAES